MKEKKEILVLALVMILTCLIVSSIAIKVLFDTAVEVQKERLVATVQSQARLMETIAQHYIEDRNGHHKGVATSTIHQVSEAHKKFQGFGLTGEFTLAKKDQGMIVFLLRHRHSKLLKPKPIPYSRKLAEPMKLALAGKSGTVIGLDYRGVTVLSAYEPVKMLGYGIVAKIDMSEIRKPFIEAAIIILILSIICSLFACFIIVAVGNSLLNRLKASQMIAKSRKLDLDYSQEVAHIGSWEWDVLQNKLHWSKEVFNIFGIKEETFSNTYEAFLQMIHPDDVDNVKEVVEKSLKSSNKTYHVKHRIVLPDGTIKTVNENAHILLDKDNRPSKMLGLVHDISDMVNAQDALRDSEEKYRVIFEQAEDSIVLVEQGTGAILDCNDTTFKQLGYTKEEFKNMRISDIEAVESKQEVEKHIDLILSQGYDSFETKHITKTGEFRDRIVKAKQVSVNGKNLLFSYMKDITDSKVSERALVKAKNNAEVANKAKSQFLANMSHEIRTPLNAILGFTQILSEEVDSNDHKEFIEIIDRSGKTLLETINNLLDISKVEAGEMKLDIVKFSLKKVIYDVIKVAHMDQKQAEVSFKLTLDPQLSDWYFGDASKLSQILVNLLSNASKFTKSGAITCEVYLMEEDKDFSNLQFKITDTGIGIKQDFIDKIYHPFSQEDNSTSKRYKGVGLGLAIVSSLVRLLGGRIEVSSKEGIGTKFKVMLQFCKHTLDDQIDTQVTKNQEQSFAGKKILVAEDQIYGLKLLQHYLKKMNLTADFVSNGIEVLSKLDHNQYDLILMDIQMPKMSGWEVTQKIRESGNNIPIIALSANAMKEHVSHSVSLGMNGHLGKPFKVEDLQELLYKFL
ncbi:MAG: response regulator [Bacteriovoracaceae bacterium]|nr:response regulator [Bacteriovoracaceae bacterium]